jgi:hypothetical protein
MIEENKNFILEQGRHFTPIGLVEYLNKNYSHRLPMSRKDKIAFNVNDIHQYVLRNRLPKYINGENFIEEKYIPAIGLKILEVTWKN